MKILHQPIFLMTALLLTIFGARTTSRPAAPVSAPASSLANIRTVFVIVMENRDWAAVQGNPSAPYINNTLIPQASYSNQYFNPPGQHPSLSNYLWLETGTNFGVRDDDGPDVHHQSTPNHLVTQLQNAGISWKSYQENIDGASCPLTDNYPYAPKHNPMVYFDDVTDDNNPSSSTCITHIRPFTELAGDQANNTTPRYNFITPNLCNDMHDSCAPVNDPIKQGDSWLAATVPQILNSQAYRSGGALFITWDEGRTSDGPIGMLVLSPFAKGGGYQSSVHYTHSSILRTIQEIFGVGPLLGDAANATDLSDLFTGGAPSTSPPASTAPCPAVADQEGAR